MTAFASLTGTTLITQAFLDRFGAPIEGEVIGIRVFYHGNLYLPSPLQIATTIVEA